MKANDTLHWFLTAVLAVGLAWLATSRKPADPPHLKEGTVVQKFTESVNSHPHCFVVVAGRMPDGAWHQRTGEINCWISKHDVLVGDHWRIEE